MQAEQVAICVVQQRKMTIVGMVGAWWLQQAYVMAASSLGGNPVIGCALGKFQFTFSTKTGKKIMMEMYYFLMHS